MRRWAELVVSKSGQHQSPSPPAEHPACELTNKVSRLSGWSALRQEEPTTTGLAPLIRCQRRSAPRWENKLLRPPSRYSNWWNTCLITLQWLVMFICRKNQEPNRTRDAVDQDLHPNGQRLSLSIDPFRESVVGQFRRSREPNYRPLWSPLLTGPHPLNPGPHLRSETGFLLPINKWSQWMDICCRKLNMGPVVTKHGAWSSVHSVLGNSPSWWNVRSFCQTVASQRSSLASWPTVHDVLLLSLSLAPLLELPDSWARRKALSWWVPPHWRLVKVLLLQGVPMELVFGSDTPCKVVNIHATSSFSVKRHSLSV